MKTPSIYKNTFIVALVFFVFGSFLFQNKLNAQEVNEDDFILVDEMPRFPGCEDLDSIVEKVKCAEKKMLEYIYTHIRYPVEAIKNNIHGRVALRFTVNTDSTISNIEIIKDIGGGCGDEVKRVLESLNSIPVKWIPGKKDGLKVKVKYTVPIVFKLNNDQKNINHSPNILYSIPCDQGPIFPLCTNLPTRSEMEECSLMKMLEYIYSNLKYPSLAASYRLEGRVVLSFMVTTAGKIDNVQIVNDIGGGCGEEAKRVLLKSNELFDNWLPALQDGKPIDSPMTIPVIFKLNG
ncbi:MAG: energy transducer TonB [Deltaproteobacteria bacterium]